MISQGVPHLGGVKQRWYGKTSLHTHTAVARVPGVSWVIESSRVEWSCRSDYSAPSERLSEEANRKWPMGKWNWMVTWPMASHDPEGARTSPPIWAHLEKQLEMLCSNDRLLLETCVKTVVFNTSVTLTPIERRKRQKFAYRIFACKGLFCHH